MKKNFIFKIVLACLFLCISLNARTQTTAYETYLSEGIFTQTTAPTGEVRFPAEFEPVQSVMVAYPLELPWELLQRISNLEDCKLITVVNKRKTSSTIDDIKTEYTTNGVNIDNCEFIEAGINSHWIRDFGPWYVFNGKEPVIVDNIYNRSFVDDDSYPIENPTYNNTRWYDDKFAAEYANNNSVHLYGMGVIHTGGNMMQDGRGVGVSDLIVHTQSETFAGISKETVNQRMNDYLGIDTYHVTIDPQGDYIAHVDCWGKFLAPDKIIIARVPSTHEQYSAYEEVASYFASTNCCWGYPYKVYRVDIPVTNKSEIKTYNKIAPYTNSLIVNKTVFVPISSLTSSEYNNAALQVYRDAMPGYEIVGINYVIEDAEMGDYSGWKNTDALHCRTRDIMDFNMLFVDHRNVLFGEQTYQESYPITAKFIAYSGNNITSTQLHYSINDGAYQTVTMTATGNADEYAANITGHNNGDVIKYYVTGEDASGKTCVQPQFGELEPHTFTAGEASDEEPEQPAQPVLDITKYYRIKTASGTGYQYLTIFDHTSNPLGTYGGVGVAMLDEDNAGQMFKLEDAGNGKYYLKSADGYYIYCQTWNVDAIDGTQKSALWGFSENNFELQCDNGYFKVENVSGNNYVFCNEKKTRATIATWSLEEVPLSVTISANSTSVTVNEIVQLNATAIGGTGNYTYSWSPATSFADATIANPTFTSATASDYTFTCTVTDNGETATSNTITITVNETQQGGDTGSDVVTIGDVTASTTSSMIPIYTYYSKSISQSYYLKDEIGKDKGTISSIAFHTATGDFPCERTISIYMKNTDASSFADKNMIAMENGDLVFNGPVVFASNQWVTIDLGTDFSYNGNNILLCVYDETGSYIDYADFKTFADNSGNRTRYQHGSASSNFSPIGTQISGKSDAYAVPLIQFTFGAAQVDPITISANPSKVVVGDEINFTVMQGSTNVTTSAKFYIGNDEISNPYTTTSAGTFTVRAEKDGLTSETTITVVEPNPIDLYVTPSEAIVGQNIKFIVTQVDINGTEQDVTNDSRFYIVETDTEVLSTYTTETAGTFTVRAEKDGLTTTATFTVVEPIVLTATPSNVTVGDEINFTVMQGSIDVTANSKFYIGTNEISNPYTTTDAGTFTVRAEKDYLNAETTIIVNEAQQGGDTGSDVVTIDGTGGNYTQTEARIPVDIYNCVSLSQQYYTKEEIGKDNGNITHIAFHTNTNWSNDGNTRSIKIYMKNTQESSFAEEKMVQLLSTDEVFNGSVTFTNDSWITIKLDKTFTYEGNNLLVCVNDITTNHTDNQATFKTFEYGTNPYRAYCITRYANNHKVSPYDPTQSISVTKTEHKFANVPFIQLTFGDAGTTPDQPEPENPTISVDKTRIEADGTDYATFTVTPADAEIYWYKGTETAKKLDGNKFNTSIHGTYSFYAKKDELVSETITVEAVANDLTITPSVNTIVADGIEEVTFSVTQVDVNGTTQDVTNKCTFKINGTAITDNTFFTNRAGDYTVTATKNSKETSAQITATALSGEENVVLIDGNVMQPSENTTIYTVPVNNYDNYGVSQQYYTKNEIGKDEGIITYIAFKTAKDAGTYIRDIEIYMANTDESDFGSGKVMKQMTNLVYSGEVQFSSNSWIKIPLTTEFTYTGNNILVCINDKTGSQIDPLTSHFDTYAKGYNDNFRTLYKSGATALDPTSEIADARGIGFTPFVKFTFEQEQPIALEGSKQIIKADNSDIIRFTVTQGVNNVTDKTEIYVEQYEGTTTINTTVLDATTGYSFTTTNAGNYRVYAKKGDLTSNYVEFTAIQPIILTVDKTSIIADGSDAATFTLMQNGVDVTTADGTIIYVGDEVITNTFTTTIMGTYIAYATRDGIRSNGIEIIVNDKNYEGSEGVEGGSENEYYNGDGSITYNKGQDNEYTLIAKKINNTTAYIKQDNVKVNVTGDYYWRYDQNKPQAATILTIPEKILFGDEWITITKIDDFAFSDKCDISEDGRDCFEPGNPLNSNFTGIIIPSTITEIGTYTFGFTIEEYVICFAKTPPALSKTTVNNPFYKSTYDNVILYVPAESIEDYRNAPGWGSPFMGGDEYYFKNIYPITMPTYVEKETDDLSWDNADNWRTYVKIDEDNYEERYGVMPLEGEDVLIDGNVRITEECVANVGAIHIISGSITIADGGQLIHTNAGVAVTLEKDIIGYNESTSPTSWYTISSPLFSSIKASSVVNLLENEYDLYRYDEPTHYWDNIEDLENLEGPVSIWNLLDAGRGYLYANQEDVTLQFKGIANHIGGTYTLTREAWDGVLLGFHLVGNPFTHDIYMNNAFNTTATLADGYYILSNTGAWSVKLGSDEPIKPCQGVLVNAAQEGELTINKKVGPAAQTRSRANNEFLTISVANKNYEDVTYVSFDAITPLEKVNHQNKDIPMVYIPMEEAIYAIAAMEDDVKEIPVAFEAKTMGQYTISVKAENCEFESMYLVDRKTGVETDLLLEDYTFLATTTDNSERFTIRLNDNSSDNEDFIFINNGEIIINKIEGKGVLQIFDVMGRYISHSEVSGSANISTEAFTSGVYIIRMTDDNGIKTQKVVL